MRRRPVNFKKSAKRFQHKASRTHKKNQPAHHVSRGGIRL